MILLINPDLEYCKNKDVEMKIKVVKGEKATSQMEKKIPKHVRTRIIGKLAELAVKSSLSKKYKQPDSIIIEREKGDHHRDIPVVSETLFKKEYLIPPPKGRLWFILSGKCHLKINKFLKESPGTLTSLDELKRAEKVGVVLRIFGLISLSQERKVNVEK